MPRAKKGNDEEFLASVAAVGAAETARLFGYSGRQAVSNRVRALAQAPVLAAARRAQETVIDHTRVYLEIENGVVVVGSDMHYWPDLPPSTAHSAMVRLVHELNPVAVIANGDVIDAPSVSKHPSIGWEKRPLLWDEVQAARARLTELEMPGVPLIWNLGNHDARFETYLANVADQYRGVIGIHLKDHFPAWRAAWATWINRESQDLTVIKHRLGRTGATAVTRAFAATGTHIITGHTHSANVWAFSNYRGTFWAVDTGTIAVPYGPQFVNYTEDNPVNWRSSVTVLTYHDYQLLPPEQLIVLNEAKRLTAFRGQVTKEK